MPSYVKQRGATKRRMQKIDDQIELQKDRAVLKKKLDQLGKLKRTNRQTR